MDATGFIEALRDDPDDTTTLLVLADWLEEHDHPRAELVRVQAQLSSWHPDPQHRAPLQRRQAQFCQALAAQWLGPLQSYCRSWRIDHGLAHVTIDARRFAGQRFGREGAAWINQAWVGTVRLNRPAEHVSRLSAAHVLAGVSSLDLSGGDLDDDRLEALLASPHLHRLRHLDLSNNQLSDRSARLLAGSPILGRLRSLSLRNNHITSASVLALLSAVEKTSMGRLQLHGNPLDPESVQAHSDRQQAQVERHTWQGHPRYFFGPLGLEFRFIPAGTFPMGSPTEEAERLFDEGPVHPVTLSRPYYLGVFEVTQQQYAWLLGSNPSHYGADRGGGPAHPVESLAWEAAVEFCRRLSALPEEKAAGRTYRLPTEAEWEHACRAGNAMSYPFAWGTTLSSNEANFNGAASYGTPAGRSVGLTTPVGSYAPTPWGLYDMHGNVWEWCCDWFDNGYYSSSPSVDPTGPKQGHEGYRALRGGAYFDPGRYCRCAIRGRNEPGNLHDGLGFRVLLEIPK